MGSFGRLKLREIGGSRRQAVRILNAIFGEMGKALRREEYVEFSVRISEGGEGEPRAALGQLGA